MITKDLKKLLLKLNDHLTRALEAAAGFAIARGHFEVALEHLLLKLLEDGNGDILRILDHYGLDNTRLWSALTRRLEDLRTGNTGRPAFSPRMLQLFEEAWIVATLHHEHPQIRSGHLLEAFLESDAFRLDDLREVLSPVKTDDLRAHFRERVAGSCEDKMPLRAGGPPTGAPRKAGETALDLYTLDVTGQARSGEIDPVFARDKEIRQIIDILSRRRKNNPLLVGEPGVGKTAVVEGLALRIVEGDVPESLKEVEIRTLDLGLLQAGAGVKGEFENRLKSVIQEVREAPKPTILFIDEAHTLIGAGGAAGTSDAANLLKPALARGELRTIAATTWSEYKKYIEKDPALERRFQLVKIEAPSADDAAIMLRGVKAKYEEHHAVQITGEAILAAAHLSDRYVAGRHLPDKAIDLLDTASARVKMTQTAKPALLDDVDRRRLNLEIESKALRRDLDTGLRHDEETLAGLLAEQEALEAQRAALAARWKQEQALALKVEEIRQQIATIKAGNGQTGARAAGGSVEALRAELKGIQAELAVMQSEEAMVHAEVNEAIVAQVIADWTGIPVGDMLKDEATMLLELEERLRQLIKGQEEAIGQIADSIRSAKAGMGNPDAPLAVFMMVGPSGVGKTETARMLAELMFGGDKFLISINMSEYQEGHTVSQLKGSPPGYVGYGEGGVLTEAVRQRPYSVVLLDETEKAHIDVMELFYQVFDRGMMRDGEGREIDFRNTIIMMTSNVGSEIFLRVCTEDERPSPDQLRAAIHEEMVGHFQAALLARMKVVPYYPLGREAMAMITRLKLGKIDKRLRKAHGMRFEYGEQVVDRIAARCTQVDSGARNIDFIIDRTVLPAASKALLLRMTQEEALPSRLVLGLDEDGNFTYSFDGEVAEHITPREAEETSPTPEITEAGETPEPIASDQTPRDDADAGVLPEAGDGTAVIPDIDNL